MAVRDENASGCLGGSHSEKNWLDREADGLNLFRCDVGVSDQVVTVVHFEDGADVFPGIVFNCGLRPLLNWHDGNQRGPA